MPHITFIHGIMNKPAPEVLLEQCRVGLLDNDGLDLDDARVSTSLIYWADLLYASPLHDEQVAESLDEHSGGLSDDEDLHWLAEVPADERAFVERVAHQTGLDLNDPADPSDVRIIPGSDLEAVPLPAFVKKRLMRVFLRDVHHYLYDVEFSPRTGESYHIRSEIRRRAVDILTQVTEAPHLVVSHSLGTVIAYDVLSAVDETPSIDALLTLGSPLGLSEVQDRLTPPWSAENGWPERCLGGRRWWNVYDRLDPVCGADPRISGEFRRHGISQVNDVGVSNRGIWRHALASYLAQPEVRQMIRDCLGQDRF